MAAAGAGAYWLYGDQLPDGLGRLGGRARETVSPRATPPAPRVWVSLDQASSSGVETVMRLQRANGPAYVTLGATDLAGFLALGLAQSLPRSSVNPQVAVEGDRVLLRAVVDLRDFAGTGAWGSVVGAALTGTDTLRLSGTLEAIRPGLAQYRVRDLHIKGVNVPTRVIPSLVSTLRRRARIDSVAADGLPIVMPRYVADVRVNNGRVTLYRAVR